MVNLKTGAIYKIKNNMNSLQLNILAACSGKSYNSLVESYGKQSIDSLISSGYIAVLENKSVVRTELGLNLSKPLGNATNEKLGTEGYQLLTDDDSYNGDGQLLHS